MKRIFMMLCAVVALVSCGNVEREYYFDKTENRTYNDPVLLQILFLEIQNP